VNARLRIAETRIAEAQTKTPLKLSGFNGVFDESGCGGGIWSIETPPDAGSQAAFACKRFQALRLFSGNH
jgi:hypothetical protein